MAKTPRLGKLYSHPPKWWHQAEPAALTPESFQPIPEPSEDNDDETRFKRLADIALQEKGPRKRNKQAA